MRIRKRLIIWGATSAVLVGVLIAGNAIARGQYGSLLDQVFGGKRAIKAETDTGIIFENDFTTKQQAFENGNKVTEEICEEGMILLKNENNALPLKSGAKVSVFGKNSVNLVYGGSGSAAPGDGARKTIFDSLTDAGFQYNKALEDFYKSSASGDGRSANPDMENNGVATLKTGETPLAKYTQAVKDSYNDYGDAALVVISRIAGENWDLPRTASDNPDRHYLELDNNERDLIKDICDSGKFQHVVILLNGSNYIDCGFLKLKTDPAYNDKIDACINIGSPGANGIMALGRILSGKVNPSGHTVDTVYTSYKEDPTWQNFGGNFAADGKGDAYINGKTGKALDYYTVEYEENIYVGYRYYETRGKVEGEEWYNKHVIYPFGFGLSYTTFSQEIVDKDALQGALDAGKTFDVTIKVKNTGEKAGKQVVQLYATAPYTNGGIEKAHKVLVGFAKTKELAKGATDEVTITVNPYDFASFDSRDKNNNGFKGYELEKGEYTFTLGTDAHTDVDTFKKTLADDVRIEKDPVTGNKVEPLFDEVTNAMKESLSRANFAGTFPKPITDEERTIDTEFIQKLKSYETTNDETFTEMPTMNAEITVEFEQLAGKSFDDPLWKSFLDQLTFEEYLRIFNEGCYSTADITRDDGKTILVPYTSSFDGPTGIVSFLSAGDAPIYGGCYYMSECLLAQTYNVELATKEGIAIGSEALIGNERGDGLSYPGWYAPGVNIHRSPFSGRNTEYYSEDGFMNGRMAGKVIKAVQSKGVYANVKHFAINDQETHRSANGISTWVDEQAMREIYLRAFEMAVKEGESKGLMTSFNRVGYEWAGGSYRLVTKILRDEWGFVGSVICDFHTGAYMDSKQMLYAGGDLNLCGDKTIMLQTSGKYGTPYVKTTDVKDANLVRRAAHRVLYCIANSNIMSAKIIGYQEAKWSVALKGGTIGVSVALVLWGGAAVGTLFLKKKKEN